MSRKKSLRFCFIKSRLPKLRTGRTWLNHAKLEDGTNFVNLTNHPSADQSPACSYDGTKIAFISLLVRRQLDQLLLLDGRALVAVGFGDALYRRQRGLVEVQILLGV